MWNKLKKFEFLRLLRVDCTDNCAWFHPWSNKHLVEQFKICLRLMMSGLNILGLIYVDIGWLAFLLVRPRARS